VAFSTGHDERSAPLPSASIWRTVVVLDSTSTTVKMDVGDNFIVKGAR